MDDKIGMDILEDLGMDFDELDIILAETLSMANLVPDDLVLSEELHPIPYQAGNSTQDIPTIPKEWLVTDKASKRQRPPRLFEFLLLLLENPTYASYASYTNKSQGIFQVHDPDKIADLWEQVKNRQSQQKMTYDKFARAIRWYYTSDIMRKTNTRYTFQFSPKTLKEFFIDENSNATMDYL